MRLLVQIQYPGDFNVLGLTIVNQSDEGWWVEGNLHVVTYPTEWMGQASVMTHVLKVLNNREPVDLLGSFKQTEGLTKHLLLPTAWSAQYGLVVADWEIL